MSQITSKPYLDLKAKHPDYIKALENLGLAVKTAGPIEEKTIHMIQLAAAAAIRSEGSVHSHARRAINLGAKPEELQHAVLALTSTIGFPTVVAALSWIDDVIKS